MSASYRIAVLIFFLAAPALAGEALVPFPAPQPLPALEYKNEAGQAQPLAIDAKLTALHFWATWCVPCVEELPQVDRTAAAYKDRGFKIVALSLDANMDKVKKFFADHGIAALAPYLDNKTTVFRALKLKGLPSTVFINAKGEVIARQDGMVQWESAEIKKFIEAGLK